MNMVRELPNIVLHVPGRKWEYFPDACYWKSNDGWIISDEMLIGAANGNELLRSLEASLEKKS